MLATYEALVHFMRLKEVDPSEVDRSKPSKA
jgi:hypothetical protein